MWPCYHLGFWLLVSITVREQIFAVLSHRVCPNLFWRPLEINSARFQAWPPPHRRSLMISSQANYMLWVEDRRTWMNKPNPSVPLAKNVMSVPVKGTAPWARGQPRLKRACCWAHDLDPWVSQVTTRTIGCIHCHGNCFSAAITAFLVHYANKSLSELQARYHSGLTLPRFPTLCHHSETGRGALELKCRWHTGKGGGRTRCLAPNSDSDILPADPFPNPTGLKIWVSQKWFPRIKEEPGFQAYEHWMHKNSAMSRIICSILKVSIVLTFLSVWSK